jgi:hypothetical protein
MIHNPWSLSIGDYRETQKTADFLAGLADLMGDAYASATGKSKADIAAMMDAETWLFGDEIKAAGFADEMIPGAEPNPEPDKAKQKGKALAAARLQFGAMIASAQKRADAKANASKAAAMLSSLPGASGVDNTQPKPPAGGQQEENVKSLMEFQAQGAEALAEVDKLKADTAKAAVAVERERVKAIDDLKAQAGKIGAVAELCDAAKADGRAVAEISAQVASLALAAADSVGAINTGDQDAAPKAPRTGWAVETK